MIPIKCKDCKRMIPKPRPDGSGLCSSCYSVRNNNSERINCKFCNKLFKRGLRKRNRNLPSGTRTSASTTCSKECSRLMKEKGKYDLCSCGNKKRVISKVCLSCYRVNKSKQEKQ